MSTSPDLNRENAELVITRTFRASRDLVWKAHTETEHLVKWWGPKGFKVLAAHLDLRPGGSFHYGLQSPDGLELWGKITYHEIEPQDRLVFSVSFSDPEGNIISNPMLPTWPREIRNVMTFTAEGDETTITVKGHPVNASAEEIAAYVAGQQGLRAGFKGSYDDLEAYLATF